MMVMGFSSGIGGSLDLATSKSFMLLNGNRPPRSRLPVAEKCRDAAASGDYSRIFPRPGARLPGGAADADGRPRRTDHRPRAGDAVRHRKGGANTSGRGGTREPGRRENRVAVMV